MLWVSGNIELRLPLRPRSRLVMVVRSVDGICMTLQTCPACEPPLTCDIDLESVARIAILC